MSERVLLAGGWLLAAFAANLSSTIFGPKASVVNAVLFIGLTLTTRDALHTAWDGKGLVWKMGALIAAGALLSWLVYRDAGSIALASVAAFSAAETVDGVLYHLIRKRPWLVRSNGSNLLSSAVDSLVFPTIAFGGFMWGIVLAQFAAKVLGGFLWSFALRGRR